MRVNGLVTKVSYWPTGCDPHTEFEARHFRVDVEWTGRRSDDGPRAYGGYRVVHSGFRELSRAGKWSFTVERFQRWQYRWVAIEDAQRWAERVVDDVKVNGRTWRDWQEHLKAAS